ncbi:MAG: glycosyltransferase [Candidatus Magasanikbacteria bacterium]|nr:glycosyltransferase [Candidatus Magasanikbacteria bacterium]
MPQYNQPLVSIITVVYNNSTHIRGAIESVFSQDYPRIEHIVIDGGSTDGTVKIIEEFGDMISFFLSEPDEGIYDALNKGIVRSHGEIIGILHSDDLFCDKYVISDVINKMKDTETELCFSDLVVVDAVPGKVVRYYMAHYYRWWMLRIGLQPPHPTVFIKRSIFDEFGLYSKKYKIAGDFDFFVRIFYRRQIKWVYLNRISVKMRRGGASKSGFSSYKLGMHEINASLRSNHVWSNPLLQTTRYFIRFLELIVRPKKNSCNSLNEIKTL